MRCTSFLSVVLISVTLPLFTTAARHGSSARRHNALAKSKQNQTEVRELQTRGETNARATFYDVGLGACGKTNVASDFIVALNSCQFGSGFPGPNCFKMITITHNGKSTQAQVMDECPGCPCGGLDMSRGLFTFFADESVGVFNMDWHYDDGDDSPPPAPSKTKKPKPSSTWTPPSSTSTWSAPSSTWSSSKESSSWSSSSSSWSSTQSSPTTSHNSTSSSTSSHSSTPSATPTPTYAPVGGTTDAPQNLDGLNALVVALGKMVAQYGA